MAAEIDIEKVKSRAIIPGDEIVMLALYPPSYDPKHHKVSKSAFTSNDTSVSRKVVLPVDQIIEILRSQLETGDRTIDAYACLTVEDVYEISRGVNNVHLEVTEDPLEDNRAHAEIIAYENSKKEVVKRRVSAGVANLLVKKLRLHRT